MRIARSTFWLTSVAAILGSLASVTLTPCLAISTSAGDSTSVSGDTQARFSPGVRDVLKMLDAKVDPSVIKAYIQNSSILYNPTANEIIALKQRGVPDDVLTAMMQRGAEVRAQLAQSAQAAAAPVPAPATPPAYDYGTASPSYYPYDYSDYGYPYPYYGYPYGYGYPYWWNTYSYPWAFYSPFFFGFHHDFDDFHGHGGFHDFHGFHGAGSFAFHGRTGWGNHGPWSPAVGGGFRGPVGRGGFGGHAFAGASRGFAGARAGGFGGHGGSFGGHR